MGTVGQQEWFNESPGRIARLLHALGKVSAKLYGLLAATLICGAAVLVEVIR